MTNDAISRQSVLEIVDDLRDRMTVEGYWSVVERVKALPSTQPDRIPLEWIDKHLEWLDNCDNDFAQIATVSIRAMVELWKKDRI